MIDKLLSSPKYPIETLGAHLEVVQYGSSGLANTDQRGVPILRMNNLKNDVWDLSDIKHIELSGKELETYRLLPGDILINRTNSKELVGKCEVFREIGDWVFASYLIRIRTNSNTLSPQFASDYLSTEIGRLQIDCLSRQIIGMTNINSEEIRSIRFPLPPLEVQNHIESQMSDARETRQRKLEEADNVLAELDGFIVQSLGIKIPEIDRRVAFSVNRSAAITRFDPHFHLPEFVHLQKTLLEGNAVRLGEVASFSKETWNIKEYAEKTFRYIEISSVNPKTGEASWQDVLVNEAPSRAKMKVQTDDIIVSLTRPHHGSIAHLSEEYNGCIASTGFAVIRNVAPNIQREYLWSVLRARISLRQMLQRASGGNYPAITEQELANILIPVPEISIQKEIVKEVHRRRDEAARLRNEAEHGWQVAKQWFEEQVLNLE